MNIIEILQKRSSCRGFKSDAIPRELLTEIFSMAQLSASNCNVQPWQVLVVSGSKKDQLKDKLTQEVMKQQKPNADFEWDMRYLGEHRERQFGAANALYGAMGIDRHDKVRRQMAMLRNWSFFDAPHIVIFTMQKYLKMTGAVDVGIYAQTLCLLLEENGLSSCMQGAIGQFPTPIREIFELPEEQGVLFGMSIGYCDSTVDANAARTVRDPVESAVQFFD